VADEPAPEEAAADAGAVADAEAGAVAEAETVAAVLAAAARVAEWDAVAVAAAEDPVELAQAAVTATTPARKIAPALRRFANIAVLPRYSSSSGWTDPAGSGRRVGRRLTHRAGEPGPEGTGLAGRARGRVSAWS
jgi:hypothetical protein